MTAYSCVDYDRSTPFTSRIYLNVKWPMRRRRKKDVQGSGPDTEREVGLCSVSESRVLRQLYGSCLLYRKLLDKGCMLQERAGQRNCEVDLSKLTPCVQSRHSGVVLAKR